MTKPKHIIICGLLALLSSCHVFEDRKVCPCWLDFLLEGCSDKADDLIICAWEDRLLFQDEILLTDEVTSYEKVVPRTHIHTSAFTGISPEHLSGHQLLIPEGEQADEVFVHINMVDCNGEFACDTVLLHKQWSTVSVKFKVEGEEDDLSSYGVLIRSTIQGVDLFDLSPVYGTYSYVPECVDDTYTFKVLRHAEEEAELYMEIYKDDSLIDIMDVNQTLETVNYDWEEKSLADIDMDINLTYKEALITVVPWVDKGNEDIIM